MSIQPDFGALGAEIEQADVDSAEEALRRHEPALRAYLARRLRNRQDVEDYVQDVYVRVLSARTPEKVRSWRGFLLRVASNLLIDRTRRSDVRRQEDHVPLEFETDLVDVHGHSPERTLLAREELAVLSQVLDAMDPAAREVFLAVRMEGLSHREAGARVGVDAKAASRMVEKVLVAAGRSLMKL